MPLQVSNLKEARFECTFGRGCDGICCRDGRPLVYEDEIARIRENLPRLLPMMMPKVMPAMLERVAKRIPMPDYMQEQMPEMMPKVMDNLMPHMIADVVPLVTQPMINYLRGKKQTS